MNDIALSPHFNFADDIDINIGMSKYIKITQEICDKHAPIKTKFIKPQSHYAESTDGCQL